LNNWFENLFGFKEISPDLVRGNILCNNQQLTSRVNNKSYGCGILELVALADLRKTQINTQKEKLVIREIIGDVHSLHESSKNNGALFQVASQFNLLEMVNPYVTPEEGVGIYSNDFTQGPACAIACGAATVYRNYFVPVDNQIGQCVDYQINCLEEIGRFFENDKNRYWEMKNGYCIPNSNGLNEISQKINGMDASQSEDLMGQLKVGIQWGAEVTLPSSDNKVSQVFCSALPVDYSHLSHEQWEPFTQLVLNAAYEATFHLATQNMVRNGNNKLFLTLLGGGAFGNRIEWILTAIKRSVNIFKHVPLEVMIVSHKYSNKYIKYGLGIV
jgi:hypothetical protein